MDLIHVVYCRMTTTLTIDKESILRRLNANVAKMVGLRRRADLLESGAFADTYLWITAAIADGTAKNVDQACKILADTLKTHAWNSVQSWYLRGRFMAEKKLRSDKTDRRIVSDIVHHRSQIPRAGMLKLVGMMKKGRPLREIRTCLREVVPAADIEKKATRRASRLLDDCGLNTEQKLQLEIKVVQAMARKVYGHRVHIVVEHEDGKVLRTTRKTE